MNFNFLCSFLVIKNVLMFTIIEKEMFYKYSFSLLFVNDNATGYLAEINQEEDYTLLAMTNKTLINKVGERELTFKGKQVVAIENLNQLVVEDKKLDFHYFLLGMGTNQTSQMDFSPSIGLPFKFSDDKYSLIYQLKKNNIIKHSQYTYRCNSKGINKIYIGDFPETIKQKQYSASCNVDTNKNTWGCKLDYAYAFNGQNKRFKYVNKYPLIFQSNIDNIEAPTDFVDFLRETYFKENIEKRDCYYYNIPYSYIECIEDALETLGDLSLVIEGASFLIPIKHLFICFNGFYNEIQKDCAFLLIDNKKTPNQWRLGRTFLKNYATTFDYENERIHFYSYSPFIITDMPNTILSKRIFLIISIIQLILCVILIYFIYLIKINKLFN